MISATSALGRLCSLAVKAQAMHSEEVEGATWDFATVRHAKRGTYGNTGRSIGTIRRSVGRPPVSRPHIADTFALRDAKAQPSLPPAPEESTDPFVHPSAAKVISPTAVTSIDYALPPPKEKMRHRSPSQAVEFDTIRHAKSSAPTRAPVAHPLPQLVIPPPPAIRQPISELTANPPAASQPVEPWRRPSEQEWRCDGGSEDAKRVGSPMSGKATHLPPLATDEEGEDEDADADDEGGRSPDSDSLLHSVVLPVVDGVLHRLLRLRSPHLS